MKKISSEGYKYSFKVREIFSYKQLMYYFAWRDLKVRYKQTVIGVLWVVIQPLALMALFSIFLSQLGRGSDGVPYPLYLYSGLTFWGLFSAIVNTVSGSVVSNSALLKKIYFPRVIPALSNVLVAIVDFMVSFSIFLVLFLVFGVVPQLLGFLLFPLFIAITIASSLGFGLYFAALNVRYRDVKQALPFIMQALFFMAPIIYSFSLVPERFHIIFYLNPMTGVIIVAREAFFYGEISSWLALFMAIGISAAMLLIGSMYFFKKEPEFVDTL